MEKSHFTVKIYCNKQPISYTFLNLILNTSPAKNSEFCRFRQAFDKNKHTYFMSYFFRLFPTLFNTKNRRNLTIKQGNTTIG